MRFQGINTINMNLLMRGFKTIEQAGMSKNSRTFSFVIPFS